MNRLVVQDGLRPRGQPTRVRHQMQFLRGFSVEMPMKSTSWLRAGKIA
jgi:hypothetical protein